MSNGQKQKFQMNNYYYGHMNADSFKQINMLAVDILLTPSFKEKVLMEKLLWLVYSFFSRWG